MNGHIESNIDTALTLFSFVLVDRAIPSDVVCADTAGCEWISCSTSWLQVRMDCLVKRRSRSSVQIKGRRDNPRQVCLAGW